MTGRGTKAGALFSAPVLESRGAARGFTADVFIADESQELTSEQMAALLPTISAGKLKNNQTIMIGTPPDPECVGDIFENTRKNALSDNPGRTAWHEWSVEEIGDVTDWQRVWDTNPALDVRLMRSAVESEMNIMPPDYFARERLGWWSKQSASAVIDKTKWTQCTTQTPPKSGVLCFSVKFTPDGSMGAVAVCRKPDEGKPHIELVRARPMTDGLSWFADFIEERQGKAAQFVIDGRANAQPLVDELKRRGVNRRMLVTPKASDVASACAGLLNAVNECAVTHIGQEELNDSATKARRRNIGSDGGFGFADNDCESAYIEACALALWGAMNPKRDPNRKARVAF